MRGGTRVTSWVRWVRPGLSPLARGNRWVSQGGEVYEGSIPACAGEPQVGNESANN